MVNSRDALVLAGSMAAIAAVLIQAALIVFLLVERKKRNDANTIK